MASGTNVQICLDTDAIVRQVELVTGHTVATWPMVMPGDPELLWNSARADQPGPTRLVAPVHAQMAKGFPEIAGLAERLSDMLHLGRWSLTARFAPQPSGNTSAHAALASRFRDAGGVLLTDNFTDAQYATMVGSADVVLLPYRRSTFRTRTSGVLLDAIAAGKPVVAVRDTWAGDVIERFGIGTTYDDGDVDSFQAAVIVIVEQLELYTTRVQDQRDQLVASYRPARLVEFLALLSAAQKSPPCPARVRGLGLFATLASSAHWQAHVVRDDERLRSLVQLDDVQRSRDDALDQVELLRRANAWRQDQIDRLRTTT